MQYPLISEYTTSILSAEDNFDSQVNLRPVLDDTGNPVMSSGNFAIVFKMVDIETKKEYAVKCFTKEQEGRSEAYKKISEELKDVQSPYLVQFRYLEKELYVDSKTAEDTEFPIVMMDWVEGKTLDAYINSILDDKTALEMLSYCFCRLSVWLLNQPFAHGDLKPDNIIVRDNGMLVLVDYDGMYVPAMFGQNSRELGSPDFRSPDRKEYDFDNHIDDLALASIALSLKAIALDKNLWKTYSAPERLLFKESDYRDIGTSEVFQQILRIKYNAELMNLVHALMVPCSGNYIVNDSIKLFEVSLSSDTENIKIDLLKALTKSGDYVAQAIYGALICDGKVLSEDSKEGLILISDSYANGNIRAANSLGVCYNRGNVVRQSYEKAVEWYMKAAEEGDVSAQCNLGGMYDNGDGVKQSFEKAAEWYMKAAEQGDAYAQFSLGNLYEEGEGVPQSFYKAAEWYSRAVEQGDPDAQYKLAALYFNGNGVIQSYEKAAELCTKAAEQGDLDALYNLAILYFNGNGVIQSYEKAVDLFTKAAEKGSSDAMHKLGVCYYNGYGVYRDETKSEDYFTKYALHNNMVETISINDGYIIQSTEVRVIRMRFFSQEERDAIDSSYIKQGHSGKEVVFTLKDKYSCSINLSSQSKLGVGDTFDISKAFILELDDNEAGIKDVIYV